MSRPIVKINKVKADRLNELLKNEKITQKELANRLGYSQQQISGIINCKCDLTQNMAIKINAVFPQYGVSWLMGADIEFSDSKIKQLISDINPTEIAAQIENDNLSHWCITIRSEIRRWLCDRA